MTDEQSIDGGLTALAGYLYQTVGALGMQAKAYRLENLTGSNDLEALLMLIKKGELLYEYLDQDAAITYRSLGIDPQTEILLVQFKFSRQIPPAKIAQKELTTILTRLKESARRAKSLGQQVSGYVLISNRELGPTAKDMRQNMVPHDVKTKTCEFLREFSFLEIFVPWTNLS